MNIDQLNLLWPWALAALPLPLAVLWLVPRAQQGPVSALRMPFFAAISSAVGAPSERPATGLWVLAALAWLLLVGAAARPQLVGEPISLPMEGRDLMLAVDLSESMAEQDMVIPARLLPPAGTSTSIGNRAVDRLTAVKAVAGDFIERRNGDRIGLILFGTQAYQQAPLTFDRDTVRTLLFESQVGLAGKTTAIGDAIGMAVKRLRDSKAEKVLILLTDGANTAGSIEPRKAAELAARDGIRIYTIGVGAEARGPFGFGLGGAQIDEPTLQAIADTSGGRFFRARDIRGLQAIYAALDELEPRIADEQTYRPVRDLFQWPLGAALLLTALAGAWRLVGGAIPSPAGHGSVAPSTNAPLGRQSPRSRTAIHRGLAASPLTPTLSPRGEGGVVRAARDPY